MNLPTAKIVSRKFGKLGTAPANATRASIRIAEQDAKRHVRHACGLGCIYLGASQRGEEVALHFAIPEHVNFRGIKSPPEDESP